MTQILSSMGNDLRVIIVGSTGGIGAAFIETLSASAQVSRVYALSRQGKQHPSPKVESLTFDFTDENQIETTTNALRGLGPFDLCIIATGLLQGEGIAPEKNMRAMSLEVFQKSFMINTFGPAMTAKHFLPLMRRDRKAVMLPSLRALGLFLIIASADGMPIAPQRQH